MIKLLTFFWILLVSLSSLSHAEGLTRLDLSIKEVMDIYNDMDNKPTLNSCRVHKKENQYYLPKECNFFVFTVYILENECVTGRKKEMSISSNAMDVKFKVNNSTCDYLASGAVQKSAKSVLTPVDVSNDGVMSAVTRTQNPAEKTIINAEKASTIKPLSAAKKTKQKKYFLQVYVGYQYPSVAYKCDDLMFYTSVIGERIYILSDKHVYADAIKLQAQVLNCGFKTWLRPADMDWF